MGTTFALKNEALETLFIDVVSGDDRHVEWNPCFPDCPRRHADDEKRVAAFVGSWGGRGARLGDVIHRVARAERVE